MSENQAISANKERLEGILRDAILINRVITSPTVGRAFFDSNGTNPARDMWKEFGYKRSLSYDDFYQLYQRNHISRRIVDLPSNDSWRNGFRLMDGAGDEAEEKTDFTEAFWKLEKEVDLLANLAKADRFSRIGQYGVLYFGLAEATPEFTEDGPEEAGEIDLSEPPQPPSGGFKLAYLRPFTEGQAKFGQLIMGADNPKNGFPETYQISFGDGVQSAGDKTDEGIVVFHERVLHIAEDAMKSPAYGTPALQVVFNLLIDLEKVVGGSSEAHWMVVNRGIHANAADGSFPELNSGSGGDEDLLAEIEAYVHGFKRYIITEGVDINSLGSDPVDPSGLFGVIIDLIAAAKGIPQRILTGSERGELASSQDEGNWNKVIKSRQVNYAEPEILRPVIQKLMDWGILPKPSKGEYTVVWNDLYEESLGQKAATAKLVAEALGALMSNAVDTLVDPAKFIEKFLGLESVDLLGVIEEEESDENESDDEGEAEEIIDDSDE